MSRIGHRFKVTADSSRAGINGFFPFNFSPSPQPPEEPIMLLSICFQDGWVNALVWLGHKYTTSESRRGLSEPCEILCWKTANDAIRPGVLRRRKWALEANMQKLQTICNQKVKYATRDACQAQGLSGFNEGMVLPVEIKLAYQLDYLIYAMSFTGW